MATPLLTPKAGLPKLIENESEFEKALEELDSGAGPIALDAERASGFKYSRILNSNSPQGWRVAFNRSDFRWQYRIVARIQF